MTRLGLALACAAAAGCSSIDSATQSFASSLAPYKIQVVQGNFVSKEQVDALQPGMSRQQVRDVLGTPLVASVFHSNRWDYIFTLRRQGVEPQSRKLTVFFKGDQLERFEGDTMPSEADFVATLDVKRRTGKVPPLEASEESLAKFGGKPAAQPVAAPEPPPAVSYPPLEPR
ncbi:outer membrane protein assembly factor BamE [uncultured Ramlibacter sp.]|uniref:outer membrane protein assembly factor BamE n=1 Tax=uncultured Ramlibacter sp. TaxID=260755 RepID=UPI002636673E|nr:outer membrane protein assembly factor BamE [uncultured Ramlibacter sp.]